MTTQDSIDELARINSRRSEILEQFRDMGEALRRSDEIIRPTWQKHPNETFPEILARHGVTDPSAERELADLLRRAFGHDPQALETEAAMLERRAAELMGTVPS